MWAEDERRPGEPPPDPGADRALREGLEAQPLPELSHDFDARVLAAVRGRPPWREVFVAYLRPALATASATAVATLILVHFLTRPAPPIHASSAPATSQEIKAGSDIMERSLEAGTPTYAALQNLRDTLEAREKN